MKENRKNNKVKNSLRGISGIYTITILSRNPNTNQERRISFLRIEEYFSQLLNGRSRANTINIEVHTSEMED